MHFSPALNGSSSLAMSLDPLTIVTLSSWESVEAAEAWSKSQEYRTAKVDAGGQGLKAKMKFGRWIPAN